MTKQSPTAAFDAVMRDLRNGIFRPVYLLMGEETYFIDQICEYIQNNALREEERDFNQVVFYGADTSMRQVLEQARRFPMMAERQVVILREAMMAAEYDLIEKYVENVVPTTVLVICHNIPRDKKSGGKVSEKKRKFYTQVAAKGVFFESPLLRDNEVRPLAEQYVREKGGTLDNKSAFMLVEHVGNDLKRLFAEIDKMLVVFPPGAPKNITPQLVEKCVGISNAFNGFELRNAIVRKDVYKVNLIVTHLMGNPKSGGLFQILPSLFSYFQNLMLAHYAPAPRDTSAIMSYLGLSKEWMVRDYVDGIRNYSAMKTIQIIDKFREIDCRAKGLDNANASDEDLAKELIFFILH